MSAEKLFFVVEAGQGGRVDTFVGSRFPDASRKRLAALFAGGHVRVDGKRVKKGALIRAGQSLSLARPPQTDDELRPQPENAALDLVYEDDTLVVINKAANTPSYPLRAGEVGTVANALVARFPECAAIGEDPREAGLGHRLDAETSGLLLAARTQECWQALRLAFAAGEINKRYWAVVHGLPIGDECEEPLLQRGRRVHIDYTGLDAHTSWTDIARSEDFCLMQCIAHTGRMHQVRAHLAHCNSPTVGDTLYGGIAETEFAGHFLHAEELRFRHPMTGEALAIHAELPADRAAWLAQHGLRGDQNQ